LLGYHMTRPFPLVTLCSSCLAKLLSCRLLNS
jgi:hypothetical protein